jgi:hypothetical protein
MIQQQELDAILQYRGAIDYNRAIFLLMHNWAFSAFSKIDAGFSRLSDLLCHHRGPEGKSRVSFIPFLLLMQRQARSSFERLSSSQSYEAWVLLRPCLESALILGKWTDDVAFARIWEKRSVDREAFSKAYSGKSLRSKSLARSVELQQVLSRINDDFMHANLAYYTRHTQVGPLDEKNVGVVVNYFDTDIDNAAHTLAMIHLLVVVQESVLTLFTSIFGTLPLKSMGLSSFEEAYGARPKDLLKSSPRHEVVLRELGLWPKLSRA